MLYDNSRRNLNKCWAQLETKITPTSDDLLTSNLFSWEPALGLANSRDAAEAAAEVPKKHCNFHIETAIFEHRHENKSCSSCPE